MFRSIRPAFTLVELLVVIAIIGILVAMVMPAIQSARESGRRTQCLNNIRNVGTAALQVVTNQGNFPSGGWGEKWGGDPDRGYNRKQPGGWVYSILAYIEEENLRKLGASDPTQYTQAKKDASKVRVQTVLPLMLCPTRGRSMGRNCYVSDSGAIRNIELNGINEIAKTDYAINGGSIALDSAINPGYYQHPGPSSVAALGWTTDSQFDAIYTAKQLNGDGIAYYRSEVKPALIKDGLSKTYLIGEKYLNFFTSGNIDSISDDQAWEVGTDWDNTRWGQVAPDFDSNPDTSDKASNFGSAHLTGFNMVMCDGSTKTINYDIDLATHTALSGRKDGGPSNELP